MTRFLLLLMLSLSFSCSPATKFRTTTGIYYKHFPKGLLLTESISFKPDSTFLLTFRTCVWGKYIDGRWALHKGRIVLNTTIQPNTVLPAVIEESTRDSVCTVLVESYYGSSCDSALLVVADDVIISTLSDMLKPLQRVRKIKLQVFKAAQVVDEQYYEVKDTTAREYWILSRLSRVEQEDILTNAVWKKCSGKIYPVRLPGGRYNLRRKGYHKIVVQASETNEK